MTRAATFVLLALLPVAPALAAASPSPAPLAVHLENRRGMLHVSADLEAAFPPALERQLGNGLTNLVTVHVALLTARGDRAVAIFPREVEVLYDVWEEIFHVTVRDPATPAGRRVTFATWVELRDFLSDLRSVPLAPIAAVADGSWTVEIRVELNPISKELLERTRELIADPTAGARPGPSRSVLGAMASYLLRAEPGTDVRVFRSSPFQAADVGHR